MKLAIMQPYFLPYIGYYQLMGAVDAFVVYDNIKYTKKGWINRNRMLQNGQDAYFSLPLRQDSDSLDVRERFLAADFKREKLLAQWQGAYRKAPAFARVFPMLEEIVRHPEDNLFGYLHHSLQVSARTLGIDTPLVVSSGIDIDHALKSQDKVIALCQALGATTYINPIGGVELYDRAAFAEAGITLQFLQAQPFSYPQFGASFVPWLSILDVMMFNPPETVASQLRTGYTLS